MHSKRLFILPIEHGSFSCACWYLALALQERQKYSLLLLERESGCVLVYEIRSRQGSHMLPSLIKGLDHLVR